MDELWVTDRIDTAQGRTGRPALRVACFCVLVLSGFLCSVGSGLADRPTIQPTIQDVRIGVDSRQTRFVLEFSETVPYRIFSLAAPSRVVIDLPQTQWDDTAPESIGKQGLIGGYRYGAYKPGITRVVIDLAAPGRVARHFILPPDGGKGARIVVDLVASDDTGQTAADESNGWADYQAKLSKRTRESVPKAQPGEERRVVVLDPGHGGVDPGAIGASGVREKTVVLAFAKTLKAVLEATGRYRVVMTRRDDTYIPLRERYEVAHESSAGLFLSIHADSHPAASLRGMSFYTLSEKASDKEAAALAKKENLSDVIAGTDLTGYESDVTTILIALAQQSVKASSASFAEALVTELGKSVKLLRNPHRFAGFAVLKSPNVPSVLVELGFLSNRSDEAALRAPERQRKTAAAMARAIDTFFDRKERLEKS